MIFYKFQSLGNDFVVIYQEKFDKNKISEWCKRQFGVGADGVIELRNIKNYDLGMWIYNADGSMAKMCGNGLKIVASFLENVLKVSKDEYHVLVNNQIEAQIGRENDEYYAILDKPRFCKNIDDYYIYEIGNIHAIKIVDYISKNSLIKEAHNPKFKGMNVTHIELLSKDKIKLMTYENGVGITNSCGSASLCSFQCLNDLRIIKDKLQLLSKGGIFHIEKLFDKLCLLGEVRYVYKGEISDEYRKTNN